MNLMSKMKTRKIMEVLKRNYKWFYSILNWQLYMEGDMCVLAVNANIVKVKKQTNNNLNRFFLWGASDGILTRVDFLADSIWDILKKKIVNPNPFCVYYCITLFILVEVLHPRSLLWLARFPPSWKSFQSSRTPTDWLASVSSYSCQQANSHHCYCHRPRQVLEDIERKVQMYPEQEKRDTNSLLACVLPTSTNRRIAGVLCHRGQYALDTSWR